MAQVWMSLRGCGSVILACAECSYEIGDMHGSPWYDWMSSHIWVLLFGLIQCNMMKTE